MRYDEAVVEDDQFAFANLAPGRYWLLAQPAGEREGKAAWDTPARLKLREAAAAAPQSVELKACQPMRDVRLRYPAP